MSRHLLKHCMGYWSAEGHGDLPTDLGREHEGTVGVVFDDDGNLEDLRRWTGKRWLMITGDARERTIDWLKE